MQARWVLLRTPLWPAAKRDSLVVIDAQATGITVLDEHELAAGKLAALFARGASRDLFDARELLGALLPFRDHELSFLERLNADGEIHAELLTEDVDLQKRIRTHPGLRWKVLNVKKHSTASDNDTA